MPDISIVIPTYNRLAVLRRVLRALACQTTSEAAMEVIVVSDGSSDGTDDFLMSGDTAVEVTPILQQNGGPAAARNRGVEAAMAPVVLFLDDDVVPLPGLVAAHLEAHDGELDIAAIGPMLTPPGVTLTPWIHYEQAMLYKQYRAMTAGEWQATARQFYTGNASVERSHIIDAGGFDTSLSRAEDIELAYRLKGRGVRFRFLPEAGGLHFAHRPFASWQRNAYLYGRNDVMFARDRGQHWIVATMKREFAHQHPLLRSSVRCCVGEGRMRHGLATALQRATETAAGLGENRVTRAALSALYNVSYYQGVFDESGVPLDQWSVDDIEAIDHSGALR